MYTRASIDRLIGETPSLRALHAHASERLSDDPGHDLAHAMRVALWTLKLGSNTVDPLEGIAAALLHDIVNVPKNHPDRARASELSANEAGPLLRAQGFGEAAVERITVAIRDHSFSRGAVPQGPLGQALQDADRLEALGAIGIMRTISTGVRMGASYFHGDDPWADQRPLDDRAHSIDHFFTKLLKLPNTMCTEAGRSEAERRTRIMTAFLDALAEELGAPRPDVDPATPQG